MNRLEPYQPTTCDCGHVGLHVNDYACIQWLRAENDALLAEIDDLGTQNRELEEAGERLKAAVKHRDTRFAELLARLVSSEQRLSRAIAAIKDAPHDPRCYHDPRDGDMVCFCDWKLTVLAELEK